MASAVGLLDIIPIVGPNVVGASVSLTDGGCHSLNLYLSLGVAYRRAGGTMMGSAPVRAIDPEPDGYVIKTDRHRARAPKVLLAAGLGNDALASRLGFRRPCARRRARYWSPSDPNRSGP